MTDLTDTQRRQTIEEIMPDRNPDALFMDGLDDAIIGIGQQFTHDPVVVYDEGRIIEVLRSWGMKEQEAEEYFSFNIQGSWVGENTPIIICGLDGL
jgi:hypothetical protein